MFGIGGDFMGIVDPFGVNKNKVTGTLLNPIGQSFKQGSPAPMFDPIGSMAGWYKPGTQMGNMMNQINDPLKLFQRQNNVNFMQQGSTNRGIL
jgi:hypothetical protein